MSRLQRLRGYLGPLEYVGTYLRAWAGFAWVALRIDDMTVLNRLGEEWQHTRGQLEAGGFTAAQRRQRLAALLRAQTAELRELSASGADQR